MGPGADGSVAPGAADGDALRRELEAARANIREGYSAGESAIEALLQHVQSCKAALTSHQPSRAGGGERKRAVADLAAKVAALDAPAKVKQANKTIHAGLNRLGRAIEETHPDHAASVVRAAAKADAAAEEGIERDLLQAIGLHLIYEGERELARQVEDDCGVQIEPRARKLFDELDEPLRALSSPETADIGPALGWAAKYRSELHRIDSPLEFQLHRLAFLQRTHAGDTAQAVEYARKHLTWFSEAHAEEILALMGSLVFIDPNALAAHLARVRALFCREACLVHGLSHESPVAVALRAGDAAMDKLIKYFAVVRRRDSMSGRAEVDGRRWVDDPELPVELSMPRDLTFHSALICPVTRERTSNSNPPMLLHCGHVISRDSLHRITKPNGRLRCPTCLAEQHSGHLSCRVCA